MRMHVTPCKYFYDVTTAALIQKKNYHTQQLSFFVLYISFRNNNEFYLSTIFAFLGDFFAAVVIFFIVTSLILNFDKKKSKHEMVKKFHCILAE